MKSLRHRLSLSLAASLIVLMAILAWLLVTIATQLAEEFSLSRLQHDGESLLSTLQIDAQGRPSLDNELIATIYHQPLSGHYYQIHAGQHESITSRSLWDNTLETTELAVGESRNWHQAGPGGQQLLLRAAAYMKSGQRVTITVAEDLTPHQQSIYRYSGAFLGLTLFVLAALLLIQHRIIRRSLQPLQQLAEELGQLEQGKIEKLTETVPLEVQPLVIEVNRLLTLMSQRLQRSRSAVGNLAHALKGPLHLLSRAASADTLPPPQAEELQQHTARLQQLIEHELKRARLAGSGSAAQRFDPGEELPPLVELLTQIYRDKALQIDSDYPDYPLTHIDRFDMMELLGNLLDNACKWAEQQVTCRIEVDNGITLSIEDDGPGVSPEQLEALTQRGSRLDESRPGHGLGLAIVKEITELYHGELRFSASPRLGGLAVTVRLNPQQT